MFVSHAADHMQLNLTVRAGAAGAEYQEQVQPVYTQDANSSQVGGRSDDRSSS